MTSVPGSWCREYFYKGDKKSKTDKYHFEHRCRGCVARLIGQMAKPDEGEVASGLREYVRSQADLLEKALTQVPPVCGKLERMLLHLAKCTAVTPEVRALAKSSQKKENNDGGVPRLSSNQQVARAAVLQLPSPPAIPQTRSRSNLGQLAPADSHLDSRFVLSQSPASRPNSCSWSSRPFAGSYCSDAAHFIARCPLITADIHAGICGCNAEGKVVLPSVLAPRTFSTSDTSFTASRYRCTLAFTLHAIVTFVLTPFGLRSTTRTPTFPTHDRLAILESQLAALRLHVTKSRTSASSDSSYSPPVSQQHCAVCASPRTGQKLKILAVSIETSENEFKVPEFKRQRHNPWE
ncbi:hypothetical protein C8R44DRAFT_864934 [Mycena epipterygia]|nr:hypothetical protein C8R44DRAFT_864934 [Mycena epipterygia]